MRHFILPLILSASGVAIGVPAIGEGSHAAEHQDGAIKSTGAAPALASFDILAAHAHRDGENVTFHMTTAATAGSESPDAVGAYGATVC